MNLKVKEEDIRRKNLNEFKMKDLYKVKQDKMYTQETQEIHQ